MRGFPPICFLLWEPFCSTCLLCVHGDAQNKDVLLGTMVWFPSVATGGRKDRIVHLHQYATGINAQAG